MNDLPGTQHRKILHQNIITMCRCMWWACDKINPSYTQTGKYTAQYRRHIEIFGSIDKYFKSAEEQLFDKLGHHEFERCNSRMIQTDLCVDLVPEGKELIEKIENFIKDSTKIDKRTSDTLKVCKLFIEKIVLIKESATTT